MAPMLVLHPRQFSPDFCIEVYVIDMTLCEYESNQTRDYAVN